MPKNQFSKGNPGKPVGAIGIKNRIRQNIMDMMNQTVAKDGTMFGEAFFKIFTKEALNPDSPSYKVMVERLIEPGVFDQIEKTVAKNRREDIDFLAYRLFKRCFHIQQNILTTPAKRIYLMAGRRAGKTELLRFKIADTLASVDDAKVIYIGRTFSTAARAVWSEVQELVEELGLGIDSKSSSEGFLKLSNGSELSIKGNNTVEDRDKLRGGKYHLAIVDEVQTQPGLSYLVQDILEPMLLDYNGQLILAGTGPKVRGTWWESIWTNEGDRFPGERYNWNLTQNPFIPNHGEALQKILEDKKITKDSPLFIREYLGKVAYDDDALVYRLTEQNYYTDDELSAWIGKQPVIDLHFTGGLDYGFIDSDGFAIILYSDSSPEKWLLYEYKKNRTGVTELVEGIRQGIALTQTPFYDDVHERYFSIYSDTSDKKISFELQSQYGIPAVDAYKHNKDFAIEQLQEDVRRGSFKVKKGGVFDNEALRTIFRRNENDEMTREIDDETFHPDLVDAILYALRPVWISEGRQD